MEPDALPVQVEPIGIIGLSSPRSRPRRGTGLLMAVVSAATFGSSGTFGSALLGAGWSPGAVVLARIVVGILVLTPAAAVQLCGRWGRLRHSAGMVIAYGLIGVVGCQVPFFYAIQSVPVGVAVLLEFMGAVLVVGWLWARYRQQPGRLTISGAVVSITGLAMMSGVTGAGGISGIGFMWGMLNAVCVAVYFFLADDRAKPIGGTVGLTSVTEADGPLSPVVLSWAGMCAGAVILTVLGVVHAMPLAASTRDVTFLSHRTSWVAPVIGIGVLATALSGLHHGDRGGPVPWPEARLFHRHVGDPVRRRVRLGGPWPGAYRRAIRWRSVRPGGCRLGPHRRAAVFQADHLAVGLGRPSGNKSRRHWYAVTRMPSPIRRRHPVYHMDLWEDVSSTRGVISDSEGAGWLRPA